MPVTQAQFHVLKCPKKRFVNNLVIRAPLFVAGRAPCTCRPEQMSARERAGPREHCQESEIILHCKSLKDANQILRYCTRAVYSFPLRAE